MADTAEPTEILVTQHGSVVVVRKLYGPVSLERHLKEEREVEYRADQLDTAMRSDADRADGITFARR